jgi:hypothetical protein
MYEYIRKKQMIYFLLTGAKKKISAGPCKMIYGYLLLREFVPIDNFISIAPKMRRTYGRQSSNIENVDLYSRKFIFKKVNYAQYKCVHLVYNPFLYRFESYTNFSVSDKLNLLVYRITKLCNVKYIEKFSPGSMIPNFSISLQDYIVKNWY